MSQPMGKVGVLLLTDESGREGLGVGRSATLNFNRFEVHATAGAFFDCVHAEVHIL